MAGIPKKSDTVELQEEFTIKGKSKQYRLVKVNTVSKMHKGPYNITSGVDFNGKPRIYSDPMFDDVKEYVKQQCELFKIPTMDYFFLGNTKLDIKPYTVSVNRYGLNLDIEEDSDKLRYIIIRNWLKTCLDGNLTSDHLITIEDKFTDASTKLNKRIFSAKMIADLNSRSPEFRRRLARMYGIRTHNVSDEVITMELISYIDVDAAGYEKKVGNKDLGYFMEIYELIENRVLYIDRNNQIKYGDQYTWIDIDAVVKFFKDKANTMVVEQIREKLVDAIK